MALRGVASRSLAVRNNVVLSSMSWRMSSSDSSQGGELGSGVGKGGGGGGTIREAGGAFGKREAAAEEQYFRKLQQEQFAKMKEYVKDQIEDHEDDIKHHEEAIERHKKRIKELRDQAKH